MSEPKRDISPIRDETSHLAALAEIERLWAAAPGTPESDRLDVLVILVDDYERRNWPDDDLDPIDAIVARMENSGLDRKDLEKLLGSSGRVSEILNRRRHLTLPMIWRLVQEWKMPSEMLVRPYRLQKRPGPSTDDRVRSRQTPEEGWQRLCNKRQVRTLQHPRPYRVVARSHGSDAQRQQNRQRVIARAAK